jgi:hypothetical protein
VEVEPGREPEVGRRMDGVARGPEHLGQHRAHRRGHARPAELPLERGEAEGRELGAEPRFDAEVVREARQHFDPIG